MQAYKIQVPSENSALELRMEVLAAFYHGHRDILYIKWNLVVRGWWLVVRGRRFLCT
jgi:hypothetical protein